MKIFEIHMTADSRILDVTELKTITVDLLKPDFSLLRTEYMTSHIYKCESYQKCKEYVDNLTTELIDLGLNIIRVKIECPYYQEYKDQSLYFEVHYETYENKYPLSKNRNKSTYLCTAREYDKTKYNNLIEKHYNKEKPQKEWTMELCLYDTYIEEDKDWFDLY